MSTMVSEKCVRETTSIVRKRDENLLTVYTRPAVRGEKVKSKAQGRREEGMSILLSQCKTKLSVKTKNGLTIKTL